MIAIVPPPSSMNDEELEPLDAIPVMNRWVRGTLVGIALGLAALFAVAASIRIERRFGGVISTQAAWAAGVYV